MFRKVHLRLTLLFSTVTVLILLGMSVLLLTLYQENLTQNANAGFQNDMAAFSADFEANRTVSHDRLMQLQHNYSYDFYLYDQGAPLRFTTETKSQRQLALAAEIAAAFAAKEENANLVMTRTTHRVLRYDAGEDTCLAGRITIPGDRGDTEIYVLSPLSGLLTQLRAMRQRVVLLDLEAALLLVLFSWYFTKRLLKPIAEAQTRQAQFVAAASHEIRNPVNTILSAISAMEKANETEREEFTRIAQSEGERLRCLTDDLLTLARSQAHAFPVSFGEVQLDTLLLACYEAFLAPAREKNIRLRIELPQAQLRARHMDGERIRQVIAILLDNAISYTPDGGEILLRGSETAKACCIEVIDNGVGIRPAQKRHIFERFYRADAARESKAHFGLGLCIAKELVGMHHGTISVKDTPGGGATFVVSLPKE